MSVSIPPSDRDELRGFIASIDEAPAGEREKLRRAARWVERLVAEDLVSLSFSSQPHKTQWTLTVRPKHSRAALAAIYNDRDASIALWRSVFERIAPAQIATIEEIIAPVPLAKGKATKEFSDRLFDTLTAAYREAAGAPPPHVAGPAPTDLDRLVSETVSTPLVKEVPVENQYVEQTTVSLPSSSHEAVRREQKLVLAYKAHLETTGRVVQRLTIQPPGEAHPIICDVYDKTRNNIVEAKGTGSRGNVRLAIGQLFDYARFVQPQPARAVLLPDRPRPDLESLLSAAAISAVWQSGSAFEDNADGCFT